jgi:transcription termination/antitermination protein NusA
MNAEMIAALRELEREKGIAFETILGGLEEAMASAYKAHWRQEHPDGNDEFVGFRAVIDPETGDLRMWQQELEEVDTPPVEGSDEPGLEMKVISEAEVEVTDDFKGRIGAQTAKQVIFQKLRDAEREMTYEEFAGREGDVVTGIVQQQERRYTLLDLGKVEALLPQGEQVPSEPLRHGERLKAFITEVRRGTKGPQIVVSRTHPGLLKALFALEVPEIDEGIVEIMAVAREPGHRSKIAVASNEPAVDPVGACVGPKGSRVRMVVNELRGEKIDVVPWSDESATFVANALQPAKVKEVTVNPETQTALVIVPDYQLSLAIGREGQNARLAARLTGWRIDIKSESQAAAPPPAPPPVEVAEVVAAEEPQAETEEDVATGAGAEPTPEEAEPVEAEPVEAEPVEAEPVEAEPVEAEPVEAEPVEVVPVEAAPAEAPAGE